MDFGTSNKVQTLGSNSLTKSGQTYFLANSFPTSAE